jgi:broad specificity polyphosphatase/5'/3'-nucleotidase SurE
MATGWGRQVRVDFQKLATQVATTKTYTTPFAGLCTTNPLDDGSGVTAGTTEPSSTGSYARQAITWNTISTPANDAAANATNSASISWTSTAAWSTGATNLTHVIIYNTSTLATVTEAAFLGRAAIAVSQAVNASGITLTMASTTGLVMGCISA